MSKKVISPSGFIYDRVHESLHEKLFPNRNHGFVYVIKSDKYCKIGMSLLPEKRISSIKTSCPHKVEIIRIFETDNMIKMEKNLHNYFIAYKLRGEWFDLPEEAIQALRLI
jgi:hypothetical protein